MQNNYKNFVRPVLEKLGKDACNELYGDQVVAEYLKQMHRPIFCFYKKTKQDVMTNYLFWSIAGLYARTEFINPEKQNDMQNFKAFITPGQEQKVRDAYAFMTDLPLKSIKSRYKKLEYMVNNARLEKISAKSK